MRVAVAGGTGLVGRYVVDALTARGHVPVVIARSRGVDLITGQGLDEAVTGADAIVDVTNIETLSRRRATAFFTTATGNLVAAGERAGVRHLALLSIVGVDRVRIGYYVAKRAQEELVTAAALPTTILRATQFHEFAGQLLDRSSGPLVVVPRMRVQPVAAREVAERLVAVVTAANGEDVGASLQLAGPEVHDLVDLARRVQRQRGTRRGVVGLRLPGSAGRAVAAKALLPSGEALLGETTFADWLATR
jgi:uncharacterized protein YbjT (DUF2867 family)